MSKKRKPKKPKKSRRDKTSTSLRGHTRQGKKLLPPLAMMDRVQPVSWMNDRLPEMIWASLVHASAGREIALGFFRRCIQFIGEHDQGSDLHDVTLTGLAAAEPQLLRDFISFLTSEPAAGEALATLRLFDSLPARAIWDELLPDTLPDSDLLMTAVGSTLWHQSDTATDLRWLRVMAQVVGGKVHIPREMAEEWFGYSGQPGVSASIRSAETASDPTVLVDLSWPNAFWEEGWKKTPCLEISESRATGVALDEVVPRQRISEILGKLDAHWEKTLPTTGVDAKHDAVFGMAFYSLRILDELMGIGIGPSVLGRLGLRVIAEVRVNLSYLLSEDSQDLWKGWRSYGAGQAKLGSLKFDEIEPPKHIDLRSVERIANEDLWEEFVPIDLGSWSGSDLRKLSEKTQLKDVYDKHCLWTSGYAHGMWGPIRESCYETCVNPLHRLHRFPKRASLNDVVDDAVTIVDGVLCDLERAYPTFEHRLRPT